MSEFNFLAEVQEIKVNFKNQPNLDPGSEFLALLRDKYNFQSFNLGSALYGYFWLKGKALVIGICTPWNPTYSYVITPIYKDDEDYVRRYIDHNDTSYISDDNGGWIEVESQINWVQFNSLEIEDVLKTFINSFKNHKA